MQRPSRDLRFASSGPEGATGACARVLGDVAVLAIDGLATLQDRPFPREVALAFCGRRSGLAWLVRPEALWSEAPADASGQPLGIGLHPAVVARELASACAGHRVFSELHLAASAWLERLFQASGTSLPYKVRDLRTLAVRLNKKPASDGAERVGRAGREAQVLYPGSERAARDAACHVRFVTLLAEDRRR